MLGSVRAVGSATPLGAWLPPSSPFPEIRPVDIVPGVARRVLIAGRSPTPDRAKRARDVDPA